MINLKLDGSPLRTICIASSGVISVYSEFCKSTSPGRWYDDLYALAKSLGIGSSLRTYFSANFFLASSSSATFSKSFFASFSSSSFISEPSPK